MSDHRSIRARKSVDRAVKECRKLQRENSGTIRVNMQYFYQLAGELFGDIIKAHVDEYERTRPDSPLFAKQNLTGYPVPARKPKPPRAPGPIAARTFAESRARPIFRADEFADIDLFLDSYEHNEVQP